MANAVYPKALEAILGADIDLLADTIKAQMVDADYTYSSAHQYLSSVAAGAKIGTAATLATKSATNGTFDAGNCTFVSVAAGDTITGIVVYKDTGSAATSPLIAYIDTTRGGLPVDVDTNGGNITVTWSSRGIFKI